MVDDEPRIVSFVSRALTAEGFRVDGASEFGIFLRVLAVLFLLRLVVRFFAHVLAGMRSAPPAALVRDRICNTFLPRDRALTLVVEGREEHFCSATCRDRAAALLPTP